MNSFISSFKTEAKVLAVILLVLLGCELALRKYETALSLDLKHIRSIPARAQHLAQSKKMRILFLGNSFTRVSVDPQIFLNEMRSRGFGNLEIERVFPDGTRLNEWYQAFNTYFVEPNLAPDLLVIITGRAHLQDWPTDPAILGSIFSSRSGEAKFLLSSAHKLEDKAEFFLARHLAICANRRRVEPRVFTKIIPHYQDCIQRINEERTRVRASQRGIPELKYTRLEELLTLGEKKSVPIVITTVPMSQPYTMDSRILEKISSHKMTFIEANEIEGIDHSHFPDGYHIDAPGAEKYTKKLAAEFSKLFEQNPSFQKARTTHP